MPRPAAAADAVSATRGRLQPPSAAPATGEHIEVLASGAGWRIEQILSGRLAAPVEDVLDHDEWVVILAGAATLDVDGVTQSLGAGEWLHIGPGVGHRVLTTEPGTSWLAVHVAPTDGDAAR
jgi:cupin 2 domain-containing protein